MSKGKRWCGAATREWQRGQKTAEEQRRYWTAAAERQLAAAAEQQLVAATERQLVAAAAGLSRSSGSAVTRLSYKSRSTRPGEISTTGQEELSSLPRMDKDFVDIVRRKTNYILFYLLVVANRLFSVSCVNT